MLSSQKQNTSKEPDNDDSSRKSSFRQGSNSSTIYENKCIFCQKPKKILKGQKTRETVIQCRELRAEANIRSAATKKMDSRVLATKDGASTSKRVQRLVSSFGQDMVYAITYGKTKPPKHIILLFAIKSLTGNVKLLFTVYPTPSKTITVRRRCSPSNKHPSWSIHDLVLVNIDR